MDLVIHAASFTLRGARRSSGGVTWDGLWDRRVLRTKALRLEGRLGFFWRGDVGWALGQKSAAHESAALGGAPGVLLAA
jgi:hypothetical protein